MYVAIAYGCNKNIPAAIAAGDTYRKVKKIIKKEFSREEIEYFNDAIHRQKLINENKEKEKLTNEIDEEMEKDYEQNRMCIGEAVFYLKQDVTLKKFNSEDFALVEGCCPWCIAIFNLGDYGGNISFLIKNEIQHLIV